jgi:hypothetical protein
MTLAQKSVHLLSDSLFNNRNVRKCVIAVKISLLVFKNGLVGTFVLPAYHSLSYIHLNQLLAYKTSLLTLAFYGKKL